MTELSEREMADVGNRSLKAPGSVEWSWQTTTALQFMWQNLELCHDSYLRIWQEAEKYTIWEKVPPDKPYGSREVMLEELRIGDEDGANAKVAALAAIALPMKGHDGDRRRGQDAGSHTDKTSKSRSWNSGYLARRIARDHPDVQRRLLNGEFKSFADAARAAGIYREKTKHVGLVDDVKRVAANIRKHYAPEQVQALMDALQGEV